MYSVNSLFMGFSFLYKKTYLSLTGTLVIVVITLNVFKKKHLL